MIEDSVLYLRAVYLRTPVMDIFYSPARLNITATNVFHHQMKVPVDKESVIWDSILHKEWAALYATQCWHEYKRGTRGWAVQTGIVHWLWEWREDQKVDLKIIYGSRQRSLRYIADRMVFVSYARVELRNDLRFEATPLSDSELVWICQWSTDVTPNSDISGFIGVKRISKRRS